MNYIGSKSTLLPFITHTINEIVGARIAVFADLFAGTGCVGSSFRNSGSTVISNDIQYYSYVLNKHLIENTSQNNFNNLNLPCTALFSDKTNNVKEFLRNLPGKKGFIFEHYCEEGTRNKEVNRLYFSDSNAKKCDAIRQQIENWLTLGLIDQGEYFQLLSGLLESADKVANTASVYAAFLKKLKTSAIKPLSFDISAPKEDTPSGVVYNEDANTLINKIEGQVLYLDPPYNHRQYAPNYHILETIARYDDPTISGISGLRPYSDQRSAYCTKKNAEEALTDLIEKAKFDYVFLSYNNEGIIESKLIEKIMKSFGRYTVVEKQYQRFKADKNREYKSDKTIEYIHCLKRYRDYK